MAKKVTCEMCGERFDTRRDSRRWKGVATPIGGTVKAKPFIVCTDCFLQLAEDEYAV